MTDLDDFLDIEGLERRWRPEPVPRREPPAPPRAVLLQESLVLLERIAERCRVRHPDQLESVQALIDGFRGSLQALLAPLEPEAGPRPPPLGLDEDEPSPEADETGAGEAEVAQAPDEADAAEDEVDAEEEPEEPEPEDAPLSAAQIARELQDFEDLLGLFSTAMRRR